MNLKQKEIINVYVKLCKKLGHHPSRAGLIDAGVSRDRIRSNFGNFELLQAEAVLHTDVPMTAPKPLPKVLFLDIETTPIITKVWSLQYNDYIDPKNIVEDWSVLAWSAKWLGNDEIFYKDQRKAKKVRNDKSLLKDIWKLLDEADIIITQNGKFFDVPKLNARFEINKLGPYASFRHMDTKQMAKKHFGFTSYSLAYLCQALGLEYKKKEHKKFPGLDLWTQCEAGNAEAWQEMEEYNKYDVLALEALYKRLSPWESGINFGVYTETTTCKCGSMKFVKLNKLYTTNTAKYQRYKCTSCGAEFRDKKNLLKNNIKVGTNR